MSLYKDSLRREAVIIRFLFYRELIKRECLEREIKISYPSLLAFLPPNGIETPTNPFTELEFLPKNI